MTENALLEALRQANTPKEGGEGMRVEEIAKATGMGTARVRNMIRDGLARGVVRQTSRLITGLGGRMCRVPGYALAKKK